MWIDPVSLRFFRNAGTIPASEGKGPVVIMYHSISSGGKIPEDRWSVSEKRFLEQIEFLSSEGWNTVCVRDLENVRLLPPRTVVITFDDGYRDNFGHGFLNLAKYNMRATWFVISRPRNKHFWLDESHLREMTAAGMEISAHTRTHARLPELDVAKIEEEVSGSKKDIEDILGLPVTSFAYPYGLFDDACVEAVRKAGFKAACSTRPGWFGSEPDFLRMRRVGIFSSDNLSTFARKIAFADTNVAFRQMAKYITNRIKSRLSGK